MLKSLTKLIHNSTLKWINIVALGLFYTLLYYLFVTRYNSGNLNYKEYYFSFVFSVSLIPLIVSYFKASKNFYIYGLFSLSMSVTCALAIMYIDIGTGNGGTHGDAWFNNLIVERFIHNWANIDYIDSNLHGFFPFYYHFLLARIADILGLSGITAWKYGLIIVYMWLVPLTYLVWRKVGFSSVISTLGSVTSVIFLGGFLNYRPYESIAYFIGFPIITLYFSPKSLKSLSLASCIFLGGMLGFSFGVYYFWHFIWFLSVLFYCLFSKETVHQIVNSRIFRNRWFALNFSFLIVSSWFWMPYLWDLITIGNESMQNRYMLHPSKFMIPNLFEDRLNLLFIATCFVAAFYYRNEEKLRWAAYLILGSLIWAALGYFTLFINNSLIPNKAFYVLSSTLVFTALFLFCYKLKGSDKFGKEIALVLFLIAGNMVIRGVQNDSKSISKHKGKTHTYGVLDEFDLRLKNKTVLTNYTPYNGENYNRFLPANTHFGHPSLLTTQRISFLKTISLFSESNPDLYAWLLLNNKFSPIEFIYMIPQHNLWIQHDTWPDRHKPITDRVFRHTPSRVMYKGTHPAFSLLKDNLFQINPINIKFDQLTDFEKLVILQYAKPKSLSSSSLSLLQRRREKLKFFEIDGLKFFATNDFVVMQGESSCSRTRMREEPFILENMTKDGEEWDLENLSFHWERKGCFVPIPIKKIEEGFLTLVRKNIGLKSNKWEIDFSSMNFNTNYVTILNDNTINIRKNGQKVSFILKNCQKDNEIFYIHAFPNSPSDLPKERSRYGFINLGSEATRKMFYNPNRNICGSSFDVPQYIKSITIMMSPPHGRPKIRVGRIVL